MTVPNQASKSRGALATVANIEELLGATLLDFPKRMPPVPRVITGMWMAERGADVHVRAGTLVLVPGVLTADETEKLLGALETSAAALIVGAEAMIGMENQERAHSAGLAVIRLAEGASWLQLAAMLQTLTRPHHPFDGLSNDARSFERPDVELGVGQPPDLFEVANSVAGILGAPVTIENLDSRILAFSADQAAADDARKQSVLSHQVPVEYAQMLREIGAFKSIYDSPEPVYLSSIGPGIRPRIGMRIRAGNELLGSIWGVVENPLSSLQNRALSEAADMVALSMLRARTAADASAQLRHGLLVMLLEGGSGAEDAAARIGIVGQATVVLAAALRRKGPIGDAGTADSEAELDRLAAAIGLRLYSASRLSTVARVGGRVYAVLPLEPGTSGVDGGLRLARDLVKALNRDGLLVGVGTPVASAGRLNRSRSQADSALRVLLSRRGAGASDRLESVRYRPSESVASGDEVQVESLMLSMRDSLAASEQQVTGPLAKLQIYDRAHSSELVKTLAAWLDHFGDVSAAAMALHIHQNTFRLRLKRLMGISGINLDDADQRFALMLQMRLFDLPPAVP
ncbi:CdaR family transcriptional regulator [Arthrobacter sp. 4R501]|uniref:PucR family transcriptional regulator n=1 Tax=Arthrobacter sp. 4R501 TaxID=2058886 RepID=UPI000CE42621|nr:helix-turn-helix domain-containing protein [Arthrobacter sp. 4R501]